MRPGAPEAYQKKNMILNKNPKHRTFSKRNRALFSILVGGPGRAQRMIPARPQPVVLADLKEDERAQKENERAQ